MSEYLKLDTPQDTFVDPTSKFRFHFHSQQSIFNPEQAMCYIDVIDPLGNLQFQIVGGVQHFIDLVFGIDEFLMSLGEIISTVHYFPPNQEFKAYSIVAYLFSETYYPAEYKQLQQQREFVFRSSYPTEDTPEDETYIQVVIYQYDQVYPQGNPKFSMLLTYDQLEQFIYAAYSGSIEGIIDISDQYLGYIKENYSEFSIQVN